MSENSITLQRVSTNLNVVHFIRSLNIDQNIIYHLSFLKRKIETVCILQGHNH